jgi:hypothetical protein
MHLFDPGNSKTLNDGRGQDGEGVVSPSEQQLTLQRLLRLSAIFASEFSPHVQRPRLSTKSRKPSSSSHPSLPWPDSLMVAVQTGPALDVFSQAACSFLTVCRWLKIL